MTFCLESIEMLNLFCSFGVKFVVDMLTTHQVFKNTKYESITNTINYPDCAEG